MPAIDFRELRARHCLTRLFVQGIPRAKGNELRVLAAGAHPAELRLRLAFFDHWCGHISHSERRVQRTRLADRGGLRDRNHFELSDDSRGLHLTGAASRSRRS